VRARERTRRNLPMCSRGIHKEESKRGLRLHCVNRQRPLVEWGNIRCEKYS
jgi:hypothetical protein